MRHRGHGREGCPGILERGIARFAGHCRQPGHGGGGQGTDNGDDSRRFNERKAAFPEALSKGQ
ncbi:hypothetical protein GCM10027317_20980 [Massilia agri]